MRLRLLLPVLLLALPAAAAALPPPCNSGRVFADANGNGRFDAGESPLAGVIVSDGVELVRTDARGAYALPAVDGRTTFVVKPSGYAFPRGDDGLPVFWRHVQYHAGPALRFGGIPHQFPACRDFALVPGDAAPREALDVLVFADPQVRDARQAGFYARDIVAPLVRADGAPSADLGLTLGDVANDDLAIYPRLNAATARLRTPWLHAAGNHDLDFDAATDEDSLRSFRRHFGPDTFAWEEPEAAFIVLDDVVYRPGQAPAYVGGLRDEQFAWLAAYLATLDRGRRVVIAAHIPFFDEPGRETFRRADRERLFALLRPFTRVLLLSGHGHVQRHHYHGAADGWHGEAPLHEYNVGAACGGYWGGVADASGLPDARMADGTPNGYARLRLGADGGYRLRWHPARDPDRGLSLHAPRVLRRGHWPGVGLFANVFMGDADTVVEVRVDGGDWRPMRRVAAPDPGVLAENLRDDHAPRLRAHDRLPEAETAVAHLWRYNLPTDLAPGEHRYEVRVRGRWTGEVSAAGRYRLEAVASP